MVHGGFHPAPQDGVPPLADGAPSATAVMVGNAGGAMWERFRESRFAGTEPDPLNRWTREVVDAVARELGAGASFPFDGPPYRPFQRWALRAETVWPSPIGILIHPEYGLWHAYRAALLFPVPLALPERSPATKPCDGCAEKPCLQTCPVSAFGPHGYDVARCVSHITRSEGADCLGRGCRARRACPVGRAYSYTPPHAAFHMAAFARSNAPGGRGAGR
jgi:hypothetical protein